MYFHSNGPAACKPVQKHRKTSFWLPLVPICFWFFHLCRVPTCPSGEIRSNRWVSTAHDGEDVGDDDHEEQNEANGLHGAHHAPRQSPHSRCLNLAAKSDPVDSERAKLLQQWQESTVGALKKEDLKNRFELLPFGAG